MPGSIDTLDCTFDAWARADSLLLTLFAIKTCGAAKLASPAKVAIKLSILL